jgi:peptide subunit release factor 1 (eRF1)
MNPGIPDSPEPTEESMAPLTFADIQGLLDQPSAPGLMVSCYADTSVAEGFASHWLGHLKTERGDIKQLLADDPQARLEFERNLEIIRRTLETPEARQARGMAVFSAARRGFFRSFALDVPVDNRLVVHAQPYIVPLLEVLLQEQEYLVVLTDTHRGQIYAAVLPAGTVRLLQELAEAVPQRQHAAGERWGKQQATIARHRDDHILHYQKELVQVLERTWAAQPFRGIVLLGEHTILEHVRKRLPPRLAAQVVHVGSYPWVGKRPHLSEEVRTVLSQVLQTHERQLLEELHGRLREHRAAAAGPKEVVDALQSGNLGPGGYGCLFLGPDPGEAVARCTACRFLAVDMPAACPRCQAPCVEANLWEEILLFALRHGLTVHFVKADAELARLGGLAVMLPHAKPETKVSARVGQDQATP